MNVSTWNSCKFFMTKENSQNIINADKIIFDKFLFNFCNKPVLLRKKYLLSRSMKNNDLYT